jgi:uncharacterized membrane protein
VKPILASASWQLLRGSVPLGTLTNKTGDWCRQNWLKLEGRCEMGSIKWFISTRARLGCALAVSSLVSVALFGIGALSNNSWDFWYLNWNLFLAWIPLGIMILLERALRSHSWYGWWPILLTLAFLAFLPNTFYLITDIIHLQESARTDLIFDVVMFNSFILNGCILGFLGVFMFHAELRKRLNDMTSWLWVAAVMLLTSFAIYIGRDLRWNTWDVLLNPASILLEVSERILHPSQHPELFTITLSFFVLLTSLYMVVWHAARAARNQKTLD